MKRRRLDELVPPDTNGTSQGKTILGCLAGAAVCSVIFFSYRLYFEVSWLGINEKASDFVTLLHTDTGYVVGFPVFSLLYLVAIGLVILAVKNYTSFWHGSKSIYFMRRLPDKWELHRRCLRLPLLGLLACAVLMFLLILLCYVLYMHTIPEANLPPNQWSKLWTEFHTLFFPTLFPAFVY